MNLTATLATGGVGCIGYVIGVMNATTQLSTAYGIGTIEARDASAVIVEPLLVGIALLIVAGYLAYSR